MAYPSGGLYACSPRSPDKYRDYEDYRFHPLRPGGLVEIQTTSPDFVIPLGFQNVKIDVINLRNLLVYLAL